jgi:hypothetical protein
MWTLADEYGRIYYTAARKEDVENFKKATGNDSYQVVELKGELENVRTEDPRCEICNCS